MSPDPTTVFGLFPGALHYGSKELQASRDVIEAKSPFRYYGPDLQMTCEQSEVALADFVGTEHALVVSSGTAALHTALHSLGVKSGDEVVLPAYGWVSDLMAILAVGAVPVIAPLDCSLGMDPDRLPDCFSKKTKAVIVVHMRGRPADVLSIKTVCDGAGIPIIEDSAQCLGGRVGGKLVGSFGAAGIFSFQLNKLLTSGEGGALVTNDFDVMTKARLFQSCGLPRLGSDDSNVMAARIEQFGLNYRMTELQGAVLLSQLHQTTSILSGLRSNHNRALRVLENMVPGFMEAPIPEQAEQNHAFVVFQSSAPMVDVCKSLRESGVATQWCGEVDPHHFQSWEEFMTRTGVPFRTISPNVSSTILKQSGFADVRSTDA